MVKKLTGLFPVWAVLGSVLAYRFPDVFTPYKSAIVPLLGVVMFGMGITLTADSFSSVFRKPFVVILGTVMQFSLMPFIAFMLTRFFQIPAALAIGLILVGCCPGGTASNVICFLAEGDVALSITLTAISTLLAVVLTPFLTWVYAGQLVPVPALSMLFSILKIVIVPVAAGVVINTYWGKAFGRVKQFSPALSAAAIVFIIAIIVGLNRSNFMHLAGSVFLCVALHNLIGLGAGYWIARGFRLTEKECRTLSIEVGMQNSGLAVALATAYFSAAALPGAVFSVWHNLTGALLAGFWSKRKKSTKAR